MIRRPPTTLNLQEADVETLKAYRRARIIEASQQAARSGTAYQGAATTNAHMADHRYDHAAADSHNDPSYGLAGALPSSD
ncbi:uncharacterized protein PSFLO_03943 [Pseudozyma flocculosa]|uniref:Uncharacterized protein n=1 Tax=Pseudozyma flocculosa TaxID=84751 RepID=A0A5C3F3B1_9BASI|nr:uncharacterized protein PSFLO_03943 [Pseudozyma flocculosa]